MCGASIEFVLYRPSFVAIYESLFSGRYTGEPHVCSLGACGSGLGEGSKIHISRGVVYIDVGYMYPQLSIFYVFVSCTV